MKSFGYSLIMVCALPLFIQTSDYPRKRSDTYGNITRNETTDFDHSIVTYTVHNPDGDSIAKRRIFFDNHTLGVAEGDTIEYTALRTYPTKAITLANPNPTFYDYEDQWIEAQKASFTNSLIRSIKRGLSGKATS